jgi:hypothetical protein
MNLVLPTVSSTLGPDWATLLNAALTLVDSHDHSTGEGVKITPAGLNLNADVTLNDFYLTDVGSMRLTSLGATLVTPSDVGAIYNVNGNLYWNNDAGTPVQLTSGGSPVAASDGISRAFSRQSVNANTIISAAGTVSYYDVDTTSSVTFTLPAANGVSAGRFYEIKDTTGSAGTNNIVINRAGADTIDGATSVNIDANYAGRKVVSDGTSKWTSSYIFPNKVQTNYIQDSAITTAKINDAAVTQAKRVALGQQISSSSGSTLGLSTTTSASFVDVFNLSVSITTTGRPVFVGIIPDGSADAMALGISASSTGASAAWSGSAQFKFVRGSTDIGIFNVGGTFTSTSTQIAGVRASTAPFFIDVVAAGTYTYKVQFLQAVNLGTGSAQCQNAKLIAFEL